MMANLLSWIGFVIVIVLVGAMALVAPAIGLLLLVRAVRRRNWPEVFIGVAILGFIGAIAVPRFIDARQRGKSMRTESDMRTIGTGIESYIVEHKVAPLATRGWAPVSALEPLLAPTFMKKLPRTDGWGNAILYQNVGGEYLLLSRGRDGRFDAGADRIEVVGAGDSFDDDKVFGFGVTEQVQAAPGQHQNWRDWQEHRRRR